MECIFVHSKCKTLIDCEVFKASRMIALSWRGNEASSTQAWIKEMATFVTLETLIYVVRGKVHELEQIWTPLKGVLKKHCSKNIL